MTDKIQDILSKLPKSPGVYQFFNSAGDILYIGKSVRLKDRVGSYFKASTKLSTSKKMMVRQIVDIKIIIANNETESLILERSLIKKHKPHYNILLKDDKNYYYIKITSEEFPKVVKTRIKGSTGKYFGPYTSGFYVGNLLRLTKKIFGYGCYGIHFFRQGRGYNLDKYIFKNNTEVDKRDITEKEIRKFYLEKISEIETFLKGNVNKICEELTKKMLEHAEKHEFEEAAKLKKDVDSLKMTQEEQIVRDFVNGDYDVVNILEKYGKYYVGQIEIRDSVIMGYHNFEIENSLSEGPEEILKAFIEDRYIENLELKNITFILPYAIDGLLSEMKTEVPKIGGKFDVLRLCYKNIYEFAHKKYLASLSTKGFTKKTMIELLDTLSYEAKNKNITFECNDISHLSGTHTVASRSVIENGKKNPQKYRKFHVKTLEQGKIDDFGSMKEIMLRRLKELIKLKNLPDLIVIDGGKGQLSVVIKIISDFKENITEHIDGVKDTKGETLRENESIGIIDHLQIVSLAKQEEELFLPGKSESILLSKDSDMLRMIQSIRDEAHRFAITFNRDSRSANMKKSMLESIPGIGPVTRKKIMRNFGSIGGIKARDKKEVEGILGKKVTEILEDHGLL
ncbi:excinuclease ABC subunit UvrC [Candidatus Gracilibacteria bacterium]|nr:excinuclease ABC subunit UvrC [Candidatus Gracilibacteria bacterium]